MLTTERLLLRPLAADDAEALYQCYKGPQVGPNAGWKPHDSVAETRGIIRSILMAENIFGIVLKAENVVIGSVGLVKDTKRENDRARMMGYSIGEEYWGRGYMTEAAGAVSAFGLDSLALDLISAYCYPSNVRSKRVLEKLGFKYEGMLSLCEKLYNGEVRANECYALTNADFLRGGR